MMIPDISRDPPRDPHIAAWLRETGIDQGSGSADWEALRSSVRMRAALPLARLRQRRNWWEYAARWARPAIPTAAAAGLALAVLVGNLPAPANTDAGTAARLPYLEDALAVSIPEAEYQLLVRGGAEMEALLHMAIQEP